mgnify:CR=1 FL=1
MGFTVPNSRSPKGVSSNTRICVIIPTVNEAPTIYNLVKAFPRQIHSIPVETIVIDGGSTDGTVQLAKEAGAQLLVQKSKGKGAAMREAVRSAGGDILVFIDGDGTYLPEELESLVTPISGGEADIVVGSRSKGHIEKGAISWLNRLGNKLFTSMVNLSMHARVTDMLSGYRAMRTQIFNNLILFSEGFEIEAEMTIEALARRYKIIEVPITYRRRKGTSTKLNAVKDGIEIMKTLFFVVTSSRPLFFFSVLATIFFLAGLYPAALVLYEKLTLGEVFHLPSVVLSSLLFITGILVLIFGLVADLIVSTRRRLEYLLEKRVEE